MNKLLIASAFFLLTGCASQPQVTSLQCDSDCKTEIANMVAYTGKFSYYTITKSTKNGFSASMSS
ncbi:hypothetical protein [Pantoea sp. S62]|uniref:hypothetical protein n=1 Tax=Pantoea sp. S62 TaxID=2769342 RepID=UPI0019134433|nr:hypothetical protein [Pantoea sp. S62]MBK5013978.1 hypothetical protein [Pantoea sp. S62]